MNKYLLVLAIILASGCTAFSKKDTEITVGQLLDEIQIAINEINNQTKGGSLPPFKNAEVVLSSKAGKNKDGSASLFLSAEGSKSSTETNTLTMVLIPKTSLTKSDVSGTGKNLAGYVVAAVKAIDTKNDLELQKLIVEAGFSVEKNKAGGIEIEIASVKIGGKTSISSNNAHKLKLVFEKVEE